MRYLILSLLILLAPQLAKAKPAAPSPSEALTAKPVFQRDGSFGFCVLEQAYPDQTKLTLAMSPRNEINLGVTIPDAGFTFGAKYDLAIGFDAEPPRKIRGQALDPNSVLLQMGYNAKFNQGLANAKQLVVSGGGKSFSFALASLHQATATLKQCIETDKNKTDAKAASAEQAMPEPLKALLITAGFKDITPISLEDIPPPARPADFIWKTGNLMGGIRERAVAQDKTLDSLIAAHLQGLHLRCKGDFKVNLTNSVDQDGMNLRNFEIGCHTPTNMAQQIKEQTVVVNILFILSPSKLFTIFTHETDLANSKEAAAASAALTRTYQELAKAAAAKP